MLTLPFIVRDLIAPEVIRYSMYMTYKYCDMHCIYQVYELNQKISAASKGRNSPLFNVPPVVDPSNEIAEVLVEALEWNMLSREWNVLVSDLQDLHRKSMSLLEMLKTHLPDRVGGAHQECGASHKQQGRFYLHSAISLPQWPVAAV